MKQKHFKFVKKHFYTRENIDLIYRYIYIYIYLQKFHGKRDSSGSTRFNQRATSIV